MDQRLGAQKVPSCRHWQVCTPDTALRPSTGAPASTITNSGLLSLHDAKLLSGLTWLCRIGECRARVEGHTELQNEGVGG